MQREKPNSATSTGYDCARTHLVSRARHPPVLRPLRLGSHQCRINFLGELSGDGSNAIGEERGLPGRRISRFDVVNDADFVRFEDDGRVRRREGLGNSGHPSSGDFNHLRELGKELEK